MIWGRGEHGNCPRCGYPTCFNGDKYYGIYIVGKPCGKCKYVDEKAKREKEEREAERQSQIKWNRENRPVFKSVEEWEREQTK
jgi:hypothetical protein